MDSQIKELLQEPEMLEKVILNAFQKLDMDKSGYLELNEIEEVFLNISSEMLIEEPSEEELDEIVKCMDINGNGRMSYKEFYSMIRQLLELIISNEKVI